MAAIMTSATRVQQRGLRPTLFRQRKQSLKSMQNAVLFESIGGLPHLNYLGPFTGTVHQLLV